MSNFSALKTAVQQVIKQNGNEEITGAILQEILLSIINTLGDSAINNLETALQTETTNRTNADGTLQQNINTEATTRGEVDTALGNLIGAEETARENADTALQGAITAINARLNEGYLYKGIATPTTDPSTPTGRLFYIATAAGTYTNFLDANSQPLVVTKGINILKYNGSWEVQQVVGIDETPTAGSHNLVESGGVQNELALGAVYDVSAHNNNTTFESLNALLSDADLNTLIPTAVRKGGMSIKFVCSSDNKYVQYRLMNTSFSTTENDWQGVDATPQKDSHNLIESGGVYETLAPMFEQSEEFDFPVTGKYLNDNAEEVSGANKLCTDYIPCKKGDEFVFNSSDNQTRFFVFDSNKQNPVMLWKLASTDQHIYICDSSYKYIRACSDSTDTNHYLKKLSNTTYDNTIEKMSDVIKEDCVSFADANVGYIRANGTLNTNSGRYKEFQVYKGTVMELQAAGSNPAQNLIHAKQCFIAKKVENSYIPLVLGSEVTLADIPYHYTFTEPMICCVSFYSANDTLKKVIRLKLTTNYAKSALEGTQKLENDNANLNQDLQIKDIDLGYMFDNIAVIGDSMSVGSLSAGSEAEPVNNFGASWLSFLAKRWGCKSRYHYAKGGSNTYTWLNDANIFGLGLMLADTKIYNAYFIAYGHNDGDLTVGAATDEAAPVTITEGVPSCPTGYSFCAYYKAIINQIRTKAPHAMIFLLPEYDGVMMGTGREAYRQAVKDIADLYYENGDKLVHHLDTGGVPDSEMVLGTHYSTVGWAYIAKRVDDETRKVMYQYRGDTDVKFFGGYNCENVR